MAGALHALVWDAAEDSERVPMVAAALGLESSVKWDAVKAEIDLLQREPSTEEEDQMHNLG